MTVSLDRTVDGGPARLRYLVGTKGQIAQRAPPPRVTVGAAALMTIVLCAGRAAAVPAAVDVLSTMGFSPEQQQQVLAGQLISITLQETSDRELAVGMSILVKEPPNELEAFFKSGAGYQEGPNTTAYAPISRAGELSDFSRIALTPGGAGEAERYLKAAAGEDLNLSPQEIVAFHALNAQVAGGADPQQVVTDQVQQNLRARYLAYRTQGLAGIAPYARSGRLYEPANDLRKATAAAIVMQQYARDLAALLAQYPQAEPQGFQESFFWVNYAMERRPNFALVHRMVQQLGPHAYVLASRQYYAARDYNAVQELGGMLSVQEGTLVVYLNRTSTDQVAGLGSSLKHAIGRKNVGGPLAHMFETVQTQAGH